MYMHVHKGEKIEAVQMSIIRRISKQIMMYTHSGILFSHKKE